jgi:hypothetical protein
MHHEFCFEFSLCTGGCVDMTGGMTEPRLVRECLYDVKRRTMRDKWCSGHLHCWIGGEWGQMDIVFVLEVHSQGVFIEFSKQSTLQRNNGRNVSLFHQRQLDHLVSPSSVFLVSFSPQ